MQRPSFVTSRQPNFLGNRVAPAGQAGSSTSAAVAGAFGSPELAALYGSTGGIGEAAYQANAGDQGATDQGTQKPMQAVGGTADNTALYNAVGGYLNTTGQTIAGILSSGNQLQIAQLNAQTQQQIAAMQAQASAAQQQGNAALAQQQQNAANQLRMFQQLLASRQQPANIALYAVASIAGLAIIGSIVYFATAQRGGGHTPARSNPTLGSVSDVPEAPLYVVSLDTFMSGWGGAEGKQNWVIVPVRSQEEAYVVYDNARARGDQKRISVVNRADLARRMRQPGRVWSLISRSSSSPWYSREGGFAAQKIGKRR